MGPSFFGEASSYYCDLQYNYPLCLNCIIFSLFSRRSDGSSAAVSKAVAREVLGRHYSDIDDTTSSESDNELKPVLSHTLSVFSATTKQRANDVSACRCKVLTKQKRQSRSANCPHCPGGKVHRDSVKQHPNTTVDKMNLRHCRRAFSSKESESSSSDDLQVVHESWNSSWSEESEESDDW